MMMLPERFWSKVITSDIHSYNGTPCLEWIAFIHPNGYGRFGLNGKLKQAHRLSYEETKGKIPDGLVLNHLCRNRKCVNPDHLEVVTKKENILKGLTGFVAGLRQRIKTHCPQNHEYIPENTYINSKGKRICRTCNRIRTQQFRQRKNQMEHMWD